MLLAWSSDALTSLASLIADSLVVPGQTSMVPSDVFLLLEALPSSGRSRAMDGHSRCNAPPMDLQF